MADANDPNAGLAANAARFRGSSDSYDQFRPAPPPLLAEMLAQYQSTLNPALVVDLGCGTGISTRYWRGKATQAIGIEPSSEMIAVANSHAQAGSDSYKQGYSHETGLPPGCADIVTCCQSLHWMEPDKTIAEVSRILRSGGVWAVVNYDLPLIHWEIDQALRNCISKAKAKSAELKLLKEEKHWAEGHQERIESSGNFRFTRDFSVHSVESGGVERLMGFIRSLGTVAMPLKACGNESELGLDAAEQIARRILGVRSVPWFWYYHLIFAGK